MNVLRVDWISIGPQYIRNLPPQKKNVHQALPFGVDLNRVVADVAWWSCAPCKFTHSCSTEGSPRAEIIIMHTAQRGLRAGRLDGRLMELPVLLILSKELHPARYSGIYSVSTGSRSGHNTSGTCPIRKNSMQAPPFGVDSNKVFADVA